MKIDISKIFILDTTPNSTLPNRFWYDTVNNQLKRYDSTTGTWRLTNTTPDNVILTVSGNQMTLTTYLNALYNQVSENQTNISALSGDVIDLYDNKQNLSSVELSTTNKTIVGAINEVNTKLLAPIPDPITSSFTPDTTSLVSFITDSTKANIQGKVLISPNINNVGAIYVGQSVTDKANAFPLYPNQIVSFSFTDITNFKCAVDVLGDSFNYVVEFGVLNAAVTPAEGLIMVGTNGGQYQLMPSGEAGSETFTITRIS